MVWIDTPPFDETKRYHFNFEGRKILGIPSPPIPPVRDWDNRRDKTGFETDAIFETFVSVGVHIPQLVAFDQGECRYLGPPEFDVLDTDRSLIPSRFRQYDRLGFCGRPIILQEERPPGFESDPEDAYAYLVFIRTRDGWRKGFQHWASPMWSQTAMLRIWFL